MRVELKKLHERLGTTAIYVTHDQVEAMTLGDRVVVMRDGWVQQVGDPMELYNEPGEPLRRRLYRLAGDEFRRCPHRRGKRRALGDRRRHPAQGAGAARQTASGPHAGKEVTFGIRPEDLRIASDADPAELTLTATVEVVERLGSEILLDCAVGSGMMVAAVEPTVTARVHDKLRLAVNPHRVHFFDNQTEAAI